MSGTDAAPLVADDRPELVTHHVVTTGVKPAGFDIVVAPARDRVVVIVRGELDLTTVGPVEQEVKGLAERGFRRIVLDLRGLVFFDSSGLSLLLRLHATAQSDGFSLTIRECAGPVRRLLRLTNMRDRLEVEDERPIRPLRRTSW